MAYTKAELQPYISEYRRLRNECKKARTELNKADKEVATAEDVFMREMLTKGLSIKDAAELEYNAKKKVNAVHKKHLIALNKFMVAENKWVEYKRYLKNNRLFSAVMESL